MTTPATLAAEAERHTDPFGTDSEESFAGYGVMGLPFTSGHVLAMRRFPASSVGPAYTSVWHRDPDGRWMFWQDQPDDQSCPRYFSSGLAGTEHTPVELTWPDPHTLSIRVPTAGLEWSATMTSTPVTRLMNAMGAVLPDRAWKARPVLAAMSRVAGVALRAGTVGLSGLVPNGQHFIANPLKIWMISDTTARVGGTDLGPPGRLAEQAHLADFWIPQRGVFAIGRAFFTPATR